MTAEHDGLDALMAAITDEPLPESAAADPAFLAEHRSAQDDVALLREQLRIIGETLTEEAAPAPEPVPPHPSRARHRARTLAFGTLAVAAVAGVVTGLGWLMGHSGADSMSSADSGASKAEAGVRFGSPAYLACATTVAEGEVTAVKELPATAELQVTVQVTRYYKPTRGVTHLTYVIGQDDLPEPLAKGNRVLFGVTEGSPRPDHWTVGPQEIATERAWITTSLPKARGLTC
ncbi:MAG: hypothetical protein ACJ736_12155 [Streptomyces sp.]